MGLAVGPRVGATTLVVGDAAGTINPFNGEGIAYGYETGRFAAAALGHALSGEGPPALGYYDLQLQAAYGPYYKVARAFVKIIGRPELMRALVGTGDSRRPENDGTRGRDGSEESGENQRWTHSAPPVCLGILHFVHRRRWPIRCTALRLCRNPRHRQHPALPSRPTPIARRQSRPR